MNWGQECNESKSPLFLTEGMWEDWYFSSLSDRSLLLWWKTRSGVSIWAASKASSPKGMFLFGGQIQRAAARLNFLNSLQNWVKSMYTLHLDCGCLLWFLWSRFCLWLGFVWNYLQISGLCFWLECLRDKTLLTQQRKSQLLLVEFFLKPHCFNRKMCIICFFHKHFMGARIFYCEIF